MPRVGAIRWDAWNNGSVGPQMNASLGPSTWRYRLPFWGVETGAESVDVTEGSSATVMAREIDMALACGIDYWAFTWYRTHPTPGMRDALDTFRAGNRKGLKYNLILFFDGNSGTSATWATAVAEVVEMMQDDEWLLTTSGRPILFLYDMALAPTFFGSEAAANAGLTTLRNAATAAGLPNPYLVPLQGTAGVSTYGLQGASKYAHFLPASPEQEVPFATLTAQAAANWASLAGAGQCVPLVTTGWDNRPRWDNDVSWGPTPHSQWNATGTPQQIADHLAAAITFVAANPTACSEPDAILVYAWNEIDEGGWLVPHKGDGGSRLQTISKTIGRQRDASKSLRARGIARTSR